MIEAGGDLDALVAERIMGWKMKPAAFGNTQDYYQCWHENDVPLFTIHMWSPSTDISAAWEVVEKIKFMQPNWDAFGLKPDHLQKFTVEYTGMGWRAGFAPINLDGNMTIEAEAKSAPHAICLAALEVMGVEV